MLVKVDFFDKVTPKGIRKHCPKISGRRKCSKTNQFKSEWKEMRNSQEPCRNFGFYSRLDSKVLSRRVEEWRVSLEAERPLRRVILFPGER